MKAASLRRLFNVWPPFLFTGIHVRTLSAGWPHARVELRMRPWNRNYVGTHFGGSLFAMTDPFWMIMVMECLGRDYIVWDKAADIEFVQPGRGIVHAELRVTDALLDEIRSASAGGEKFLHWCPVDFINSQGEVVARVRNQLYVRRKRAVARRRPQASPIRPA